MLGRYFTSSSEYYNNQTPNLGQYLKNANTNSGPKFTSINKYSNLVFDVIPYNGMIEEYHFSRNLNTTE